jgi:ribosomal protein S18 acetylase RimI-like enzyme
MLGATAMTLTLSLISQGDILAVAALAGAAFRQDAVDMPALPQDAQSAVHDDVAKHAEWMREKVYYKCTMNGSLVGSLILQVAGDKGSIFGLHVDPDHMNLGIGTWMLRTGMGLWPRVALWSLETPDYATRNHHFYEKNGFLKVGQTPVTPEVGFGFVHYEKRTQQSNTADPKTAARFSTS